MLPFSVAIKFALFGALIFRIKLCDEFFHSGILLGGNVKMKLLFYRSNNMICQSWFDLMWQLTGVALAHNSIEWHQSRMSEWRYSFIRLQLGFTKIFFSRGRMIRFQNFFFFEINYIKLPTNWVHLILTKPIQYTRSESFKQKISGKKSVFPTFDAVGGFKMNHFRKTERGIGLSGQFYIEIGYCCWFSCAMDVYKKFDAKHPKK